MSQKVTIDGVAYNEADLNANARKMLRAVSAADAQIRQLKQQLDMINTARQAYVQALKENLPAAPAPGNAPLN